MSQAATILIADDDPLLQALLHHKLSAAGYEIVAVGDGAAVLECIRKVKPDIVVLDAMMPVMDGFETLRRIKTDPELAATPVVMLTAMRRDADIVEALRLGAADYLPKPFSPDELVLRLRRLIPPTRASA